MEEIKNTISSAQKAAQQKYDQKTKTVSIKNTPADMKEYQRLKSYLDMSGQSMNGFIKSLIHNFIESGQAQRNVTNRATTPIEEHRKRQEQYYPYYYISTESMQLLYNKFGQKVMSNILNKFTEYINDEIDYILEDKGDRFEEWVEEIEQRMEEGEFQERINDEICIKLIKEMNNIF